MGIYGVCIATTEVVRRFYMKTLILFQLGSNPAQPRNYWFSKIRECLANGRLKFLFDTHFFTKHFNSSRFWLFMSFDVE